MREILLRLWLRLRNRGNVGFDLRRENDGGVREVPHNLPMDGRGRIEQQFEVRGPSRRLIQLLVAIIGSVVPTAGFFAIRTQR